MLCGRPQVVFVVAFGISSISYETHDHLIYNDLSIDVDFGYGTFQLNFHRFDRLELDLRGRTQP